MRDEIIFRVDSCRAKDKFKCDISLSSYYLFRFFLTFRDYQNFMYFLLFHWSLRYIDERLGDYPVPYVKKGM